MSNERNLNRYTGYLSGWCQAFGGHDKEYNKQETINWLFGENQVGLILADEFRQEFYEELWSNQQTNLMLMMAHSSVQIGGVVLTIEEKYTLGMSRLLDLIQSGEPIHLYLTYHLLYPPGTRIVTFSRKRPLGLIYKEVAPLKVLIL